MCSMLKTTTTPQLLAAPADNAACFRMCCSAAAAAAGRVLVVAADQQELQQHAAVADTSTASDSTASSALPWLFLFGGCCCCLCWASTALGAAGTGSSSSSDVVFLQESARDQLWCVVQEMNDPLVYLARALAGFGGTVHAPRPPGPTSGAAAGKFSAWGYDIAALMQLVAAVQGAAADANQQVEGEGVVSVDQVTQVAQGLQGLGVSLTCFAHPHACNNPSCCNVSGPSEMQLVSRRSSLCSACRTARYCGRVCQKAHYKQHKPVCEKLVAAAAAEKAAAEAAAAAGTAGFSN